MRLGDHHWVVSRAAFGPRANIQWDWRSSCLTLRIKQCAWPGTKIYFDLTTLLYRKIFSDWRLRFEIAAFGFSATVPFETFVHGEYAEGEINQAFGNTIVEMLGGNPLDPTSVVRFGFDANLTWRIRASSGLSLANQVVDVSGMAIRVHRPLAGPLDRFLARENAQWSTSVQGIEPRVSYGKNLFAGETNQGLSIFGEPLEIKAVAIQRWDGSAKETIIGHAGTWRVHTVAESGFRSGGFETDFGWVLHGTSAGTSHAAANLPLSSKPHAVLGGGFTAVIHGEDVEHGIRLYSAHGRIRFAEIRGLLTYLSVPLSGADFSRLDFDDVEADFSLDGAAPQLAPLTASFETVATPVAYIPEGKKKPADLGGIALLNLGPKGQVEAPLSRARLRVVRGDDLLSLIFKFHALKLSGDRAHLRIVPLDPNGESCVESCSRPVLVAEFPPQHVLERAFLRQLQTTEEASDKISHLIPPDVPIDKTLLFKSDGTLLNPSNATDRQEIERRKENLDPSYRDFRTAFNEAAKTSTNPVIPPNQQVYFSVLPLTSDQRKIIARIFDVQVPDGEKFVSTVEARLSGPSRLAFAIPCEDGVKHGQKIPAGLDFTVAALTNWSELELVVVRRAEKVLTVDEKVETNVARLLEHRGIPRGHRPQQRLVVLQNWRNNKHRPTDHKRCDVFASTLLLAKISIFEFEVMSSQTFSTNGSARSISP